MAEAIELNFPAGKTPAEEINTIVEETVRELTKEVDQQDLSNEHNPYLIENYYDGDNLGADVLKINISHPGKTILMNYGNARPLLWLRLSAQKN